MRYMVFDLETENHNECKRFANPFSDKNWVVMRGWKVQGDTQCSYSYHPTNEKTFLNIPDDVTLLVGLNIKFDLLYEWENEQLKKFFKRGGRIWCCQLAEYLLEGMHQDYHMVSMDKIVEKYGGRKKVDSVKALWEMGMLTSQIDKDMLLDYLIGTEEELRNSGDIGNTELIFLGQIKRAVDSGMLPMIQARMDSLLCTTEMEYNGLKIDMAEASRRAKELETELADVEKTLQEYIPELPEGLEFNWASPVHVSALIFGGTIKYEKSAPYIDPNTGELARKKATEEWPLVDGVPVSPKQFTDEQLQQDVFTSGKKKGMARFKKVEVPGEIKTKKQDFFFELSGYTVPKPEWATALADGSGGPVYQTNDDVITELASRDIPFLKALAKRSSIVKDLGTYYVRYNPTKKDFQGMLTCVMRESHIIHHSLNHVATVTSRLSSSNPNLQNIPRGDTSEVKKMFISRFKDGSMLEADYSQLEVVIQGMLSGDKNLCSDLKNKIDFHCKRVAYRYGCTYEEALYRCKNDEFPDHKIWKVYRTKCKEFSFQRAYGAGAPAIAASTGMSVEDVQALIEAEETMYPGVVAFNHDVEVAVKESAVPFKDPIRGFRTFRRGYWQSPTGTKYTFRSYDAPAFLKKRGIDDSFKPTEMKNYPVQGTGGEVVQIILGILWRKFVETDNYNGLALLCNTVHDCVWIDVDNSVLPEVAKDVKTIMESVPETMHKLYGMQVDVPFPVELEIGPNLYNKTVYHI